MTDQFTTDSLEFRQLKDSNRSGFTRRHTDHPDASESAGYAAQQDVPVVHIYSLGRFSLLLNGRPAEFGRKAPRRPLEMLKAIIALGGRETSTTSLMAALWPDVDGDSAKRTFDITLHRLRMIIGDDRVLVLKDGKLTLNRQFCQVDVWNFERLLGQAQRLMLNDTSGDQVLHVGHITGNMIGLYQGHFLSREEMTPWSVSMHERLRSKFIHHLLEAGRYMEKQGCWEQAMHCYRKGIDVDDLVEAFHQRLMACCLETQRLSEGMSVYRHCARVMSITLGLQPEPATETLYRALRNARINSNLPDPFVS